VIKIPWTSATAKQKNKSLSDSEAATWARVANSALKNCQKNNGSGCDGRAVKIANGVINKNRKKNS
jgi:hypothetical protein